MGLFAKRTYSKYNNYASHPDILNQIAREAAQLSLTTIKKYIGCQKKPPSQDETAYCIMDEDYWDKSIVKSISVVSHSYLSTSWYTINFEDYGMVPIPSCDSNKFLEALIPFFKQQVENKLPSIFSTQYTYNISTCYCGMNSLSYLNDKEYPSIKIRVYSISDHISNVSTPKKLNNW